MVMCEVPLSRFEELLLGIAREARPALAVGDPTVPFRDLGHVAFVIAACRHPERPAEGVGWRCPGFHWRARSSAAVVDTFPERCQRKDRSVKARGFSSAGGCLSRSTACKWPMRSAAGRCRCCSPTCVLNRDRYVGREELIGALWPFQAPRSQDAALRTLLSRLRSVLGSSALAGRDELGLVLPEPVWIDIEAAVIEVQRAQQTLERGDVRSAWALAQVPLNIAGRGLLPGSQARWLEPRRRELEDVRLRALEVIGRAGLSMGGTQLASVERAARNLIEAEPYRESGYALLMEALALQGNVAEGLLVFDRLRTLLRDELGTMPSAETIAVHERLLRPRRPPRRRRRRPGRHRGVRGRVAARARGARPRAAGRARTRDVRARAAVAGGHRGAGGGLAGPDRADGRRPGDRQDAPGRGARAARARAGRVRGRRARPAGDAGRLPAVRRGAAPVPRSTSRWRSCRRPRATMAPSSPG